MLKLEPGMTLTRTIDADDAGIIIKRNGEFKVFTTGDLPTDGNLTEEQEIQGTTLMLLLLALQSPDIMGELHRRLEEQMDLNIDFITEENRH